MVSTRSKGRSDAREQEVVELQDNVETMQREVETLKKDIRNVKEDIGTLKEWIIDIKVLLVIGDRKGKGVAEIHIAHSRASNEGDELKEAMVEESSSQRKETHASRKL